MTSTISWCPYAADRHMATKASLVWVTWHFGVIPSSQFDRGCPPHFRVWAPWSRTRPRRSCSCVAFWQYTASATHRTCQAIIQRLSIIILEGLRLWERTDANINTTFWKTCIHQISSFQTEEIDLLQKAFKLRLRTESSTCSKSTCFFLFG